MWRYKTPESLTIGSYTTKLHDLNSSEFRATGEEVVSERVSYPVSTINFEEIAGFQVWVVPLVNNNKKRRDNILINNGFSSGS